MFRRSWVGTLAAGLACLTQVGIAQAAAPAVGRLSPIGCVGAVGTTTCSKTGTGVGRAFSAAVSQDGRSLYMAQDSSGTGTAALVRFDRGSGGQLSARDCYEPVSTHICGAGHQLPGFSFGEDVAVSPDGHSVYVTTGTGLIETFARAANGSLKPLGCYEQIGGSNCGAGHEIPGLGGDEGVLVSPDGRNVYVAAYDSRAVTSFARAANGSLTPLGCIEDPGGDNSTPAVHECGAAIAAGMKGATGIAISPNGASVYVAGFTSGALVRFDRRAGGALTPAGCIGEVGTTGCAATAHGLIEVNSVAVSPDGRNVYTHAAADNGSLGVFNRSSTGSLTAVTCIGRAGFGSSECPTNVPGNSGNIVTPRTIVVSPDGRSVYVASNLPSGGAGAVLGFARSAAGVLSYAGCFEGAPDTDCGTGSTPGLTGANGVTVSPLGDSVYVTSNDGVAAFSRVHLQPVLSALTLSPRAFAARRGRGASTTRVYRGTRVSFRLNAPDTVTFVVLRAVRGRRKGGRCVAPTRRNRRARSCTRLVRLRGSFSIAAQAGVTRFKFTGRIGNRRLRPGSYRLMATPLGGRSAAASFRILRK